MLYSLDKKILSYTILFLNSHPELKRNILKVICRFPNLKDRLKRMTMGGTSRSGESLWQRLIADAKRWIVGQRLMQKILRKILAINYRVENRLDKLVIKSIEADISIGRPKNKNENMGNQTIQAQKLYEDLKKALAVNNKKGM